MKYNNISIQFTCFIILFQDEKQEEVKPSNKMWRVESWTCHVTLYRYVKKFKTDADDEDYVLVNYLKFASNRYFSLPQKRLENLPTIVPKHTN